MSNPTSLPLAFFIVSTILLLLAIYFGLAYRRAAREAAKWRHSHEIMLVSFKRKEDILHGRLTDCHADADRLGEIVDQYLKDMDATAALLQDEQVPLLVSEREAIRLHRELVKSRNLF